MKEFDNIAAVATPLGEGGISIIRISGDKSLDIVSSIFKGKNDRSLDDIKPYSMRYGFIIEKESKEIIDEVLVSYMKGPRSFTAEDTLEINCHGGVIHIIRSKTDLSMKSALKQAEGTLSKEINSIRNKMIKIIAHIEATVDYPEDDLEEITGQKIKVDLKEIINKIDNLISASEEGKILREGLNTVIVGKPNVGKSSLLNALINENKAIVTEIPGTTRDVIEEYINIDGIPIKIVDTAGIRETEDVVEKIGVEKSKEKIDEADLVIFMLDLSRKIDEEDIEIMEFIKNKKYIVLLNKLDLNKDLNKENHFIKGLDSKYIIKTSVKNNSGLNELKECIKDLFFSGEIKSDELIVTNARHQEALIRAKEACLQAIETLSDEISIDLASIDIRNGWKYLGEITGDTLDENIIDKIFSEFCLGK